MDFDLNKRYCYYFNELCKIPHGSFNEKALSDYIVEFAKSHGLKYVQDEGWNVIVYKEGSKGYENAPALLLQAHTDMVCEKEKDVDFDFEKDPLNLYVEDGYLKAKGTTLGADDGTGVAYMLAILEDDDLVHPPLECAFTTREEVGLLGALELKGEYFNAKKMISLDGGGEIYTMMSSAGGCIFEGFKEMSKVKNDDPTYKLIVGGLSGGHSGGEIHKEKGNSNKLAVRFIEEAKIKVKLVSIDGGTKDNAIPRDTELVFTTSNSPEEIKESFEKTAKDISEELEFSDAGFKYELIEVAKVKEAFEEKASKELLDYIYLVPNGFQNKSMAIEGLTITSLNLGVVKTKEDGVAVQSSIRSALESGISNLVGILSKLAEIQGLSYEVSAYYPSWSYSEVSELREIYRKVLKELQGVDLITGAAHGGCECGVFKKMIEGVDIINFGPMASGVHTPEEKLDLASFDRTYAILCGIVSECAKG